MHKRILPRLIIDLMRQKSPFFEGLKGLPIDSVPTIVLPLEGAPVVISQAVSEVCQQHGAATYSLTPLGLAPTPVTEPFSVLFTGTCYAIARGFKVQEL